MGRYIFFISAATGPAFVSGYLVLLQLEIIRFRGLVFRVHDGVYGEYVEGFDELEEFLIAVQADVEIGELAHQQAAQEAVVGRLPARSSGTGVAAGDSSRSASA